MKIKTSELTDAALDWAVCKSKSKGEVKAAWFLGNDYALKYSSEWAHGGPIIEQEGIEVVRGNDLIFPKGNEKGGYIEPLWLASCGGGRKFHGPTPLIAAMRCFCSTKLGDEVEIPDELVPPSRNK